MPEVDLNNLTNEQLQEIINKGEQFMSKSLIDAAERLKRKRELLGQNDTGIGGGHIIECTNEEIEQL